MFDATICTGVRDDNTDCLRTYSPPVPVPRYCGDCGNDFRDPKNFVKGLEPGDHLYEYDIEGGRPIGIGGSGVVYRGRNYQTGQDVAIKADYTGKSFPDLQIIGGLESIHLPRMYGAYTHRGIQYLVSDLVEGNSLQNYLNPQYRLTYEQLAPIIIQVCNALEHLHVNNIIHRDVKPANIMVNEWWIAKLLDFNISMSDTVAPVPAVSQPYSPPEQWRQQPQDERSVCMLLGHHYITYLL